MNDTVSIDRKRAALLIQDMQNDVMMEGGAWEETGAAQHAKDQNAVENCKRLADACRKAGIPVIHVWYIVEDGAPGLKLNAPLFEGVKSANALVRGSWGAAPAAGCRGLRPAPCRRPRRAVLPAKRRPRRANRAAALLFESLQCRERRRAYLVERRV